MMGNEKILSLADDVIEILKKRESIELNELAKCTNTEPSEIKHLIDLLEQKGIIEVKYQMTKTQISLNGYQKEKYGKKVESVPVDTKKVKLA